VVRTEVAVRRELGGVGLGPAQVRGVPPVEQTMPHKRARYALRGILPAYGIQSAMHRSLVSISSSGIFQYGSVSTIQSLEIPLNPP
jgi:hypothetical protein